MLRLCSKSTRFYPGRPVRHAVRILTASDTATYQVIGKESAGVMLGAGETSRTRVRRTPPAEGLNTEQGRNLNDFSWHEESDRRSEHGGTSLNRPTQFTIRLRPDKLCETPSADPHTGCCVGRGREKLPLTRLGDSFYKRLFSIVFQQLGYMV